MDVEEFRVRGKEMVDYICEYSSNLRLKRVTPNVEIGFLKDILPTEAPNEPEKWDDIMADLETKIMPGITHWQHPHFYAYFPSGTSYPSILGEMVSSSTACLVVSWASSPACAELEEIVLNWFGKAIGLPNDFITSCNGSKGGGVIEGSASECILVTMLAARNQAIKRLKSNIPNKDDSYYLPRLVAYCSKESHSCVEKAAMISLIKLRILDGDENGSLRGDTLEKAMKEDEALGLVPFFVSTILGSTASGAFDALPEIGPICKSRPCIWLHVDSAYAGNGFICPELKPLMAGIEYADSFNTNPNKWLLVNFDCSCLWVRDRFKLTSALIVDPLYLQHANSNETIDYRHWGINLSRRFRSIKLWFVLRKYGISGLQSHIRNHIRLAKYFESLIRQDNRFEVVNDVKLGLVCFRLCGTELMNRNLLASINASGKLHMVPAMSRDKYIIRFCIAVEKATDADMEYAWSVIREHAEEILVPKTPEAIVKPPLTRERSRRFSFTRSVSKEIYDRSRRRSSLYDGATPILIHDEEMDDSINEQNLEKEHKSTSGSAEYEVLQKEFNDFSINKSNRSTNL